MIDEAALRYAFKMGMIAASGDDNYNDEDGEKKFLAFFEVYQKLEAAVGKTMRAFEKGITQQ